MTKLITIPPVAWDRPLGWLVPGENCSELGYAVCKRAYVDPGTLEVPNGSNRGVRIDKWTKRAGLPVPQPGTNGQGWYWCAIWVGCVFADANALVPDGFAATNNWKDHLVDGGRDADPQPGDAILYGANGTAHHIGIIVRLPDKSSGQDIMLSIEGNRSYAGTTSNNGVAVDIGPVLRADIMGFIRPQSALPTKAA